MCHLWIIKIKTQRKKVQIGIGCPGPCCGCLRCVSNYTACVWLASTTSHYCLCSQDILHSPYFIWSHIYITVHFSSIFTCLNSAVGGWKCAGVQTDLILWDLIDQLSNNFLGGLFIWKGKRKREREDFHLLVSGAYSPLCILPFYPLYNTFHRIKILILFSISLFMN